MIGFDVDRSSDSNKIHSDLLTAKWVQNHWKLIVWTLASTERAFAAKLAGSYCNFATVLLHLKYRYEWELNQSHLSVLNKIYRGDFPSSCFLVLAVSRIVYGNDSNRMWLTDGWYEMESTFLDSEIESLVQNGSIKVGDKLKICMARRDGPNCEPFDNQSVEVSLKIGRNSVRKARWHQKLGFHKAIGNAFRVSLRTIRCNGGSIPMVYCCVTRKYENQYSITLDGDSRGKIYNEKARERADREFEKLQQQKMIEIRLQFAKEMGLDRFLEDDPGYDENIDRQELCRKMDRLKDRVQQEMQRVAESRRVSVFFMCKIRELGRNGMLGSDVTEITVWNPDETVPKEMSEGRFVRIFNVNASGRLCLSSNLPQLSGNSRSKYLSVNMNEMGYDQERVVAEYNKYKRRYHVFDDAEHYGLHFEFDLIGCIVMAINGDQQIFIMNLSGDRRELVSIEMTQNEYIVHLKSAKEGTVLIIRDIKYRGFDGKLSVHNAFTDSKSQFVNSAPRNIQFKEAKQFVMSANGRSDIESARNTIARALGV